MKDPVATAPLRCNGRKLLGNIPFESAVTHTKTFIDSQEPN